MPTLAAREAALSDGPGPEGGRHEQGASRVPRVLLLNRMLLTFHGLPTTVPKPASPRPGPHRVSIRRPTWMAAGGLRSYTPPMDVARLDVPGLPGLLRYLEGQPDVAAAWVFGSRARGDHRPDSDIDVAILAARGWDQRPDSLARLVAFRVEVPEAMGLSDDQVDAVVAQEMKPLVAFALVRDGVLIYDRDPVLRVEWQIRAFHRGMDARRMSRMSWEARVARVREGRPA